jgi:hypothetical protein
MPQTVAGKSTTARVMSESRASVKGSGRRKTTVKMEKTWERLKFPSCMVMVHWQRANERKNNKKLNMNLGDEKGTDKEAWGSVGIRE